MLVVVFQQRHQHVPFVVPPPGGSVGANCECSTTGRGGEKEKEDLVNAYIDFRLVAVWRFVDTLSIWANQWQKVSYKYCA